MTRAMWFVWMLRTDIRGDTPIHDPEGQQDFVCWWLAFGHAEYPAVWTFSTEQAAVVAAISPGAILPRLLLYLVRCRVDLALTFLHHGEIDAAGLACWYRITGPSELPVAPPLPPHLVALTEQPSALSPWHDHGTQVPRIAVELWNRAPHLQARWPATDPQARTMLAQWFVQAGHRLLPRSAPPANDPPPAPAPPSRPAPRPRQKPGVNLVGYPRGELGIGEDVRMLSAALDAAKIPHAIIDVPFGPSARRGDDSVAGRITTTLDHPITIFCLTAFDTADLYLRHGDQFFSSTYRIGNWPWELPIFPHAWRDAYGLVDEVWAMSSYTLQAYAGSALQKPLHLLPSAVAIPAIRHTQWRQRLPNPAAFTFVVPFDPHSSFQRKNPVAAVHAFRMAFHPGDPSVALLLRINGDPAGRPGWPELQAAAAGDPRIVLWTQTLDRDEALGILHDADCLVSPHRAEGFGRNIAEAKLLGTKVLATGFSGNTDFTAPAESIDWRPVPLAPGEYPHSDGLWWAEPSIEHLAQRMRDVSAARSPRKSLAAIKAASTKNLRQTGQAYAARISAIASSLAEAKPAAKRARKFPLPSG